MHPRRLPLVLSLACAAALISACSSAAGSAAPGATGAAPTSAATTAVTPGAQTTENPQASIDIGAAAQTLASVSSYKVSMKTTGTKAATVDVISVKGPPIARSITAVTGGQTIRVVEIGTDVWIDEGTGTFAKNAVPMAAADAMLQAFDPLVLMTTLTKTGRLQAAQNQGVESKNGVQATHLHADSSTAVPAGASPIPAGATADLWVAVDGGYVVALETKGFAGTSTGDITIEVTNVNDSSLTVTPPA